MDDKKLEEIGAFIAKTRDETLSDIDQRLQKHLAELPVPEAIAGVDGVDGQDRPLIEPVELVQYKDYDKNTLGTYAGGLWISTKKALGNPDDDPLAWHCVLDAMKTMSVELKEDHTYKLSVEMGTGKVIEDTFHIPYPEHKGIWEEGKFYKSGQMVTKGHSFWQCIEDTNGAPPGNGWQQILTAPRGKTGPAGKSITGPQGVPGRNGTSAEFPDGFLDNVMALASERKAFEDGRSAAEAITSFRGYFANGEDYSSGDVVNFDGGLYLCLDGGRFDSIARAADSWELMLVVPKFTSPAYMLWKGLWQTGNTYHGGHVVRDGAWTMVALTKTDERPAPYPTGDEAWIFDGTLSPFQNTAKQVIFGTRFTAESDVFINGLRVDTVAGNDYRIYTVTDPTGRPVVNELYDFTSDVDGWVNLAIDQTIVGEGALFDVVAVVTEPAGTPTTFTGDWNYTTPNNTAVPAAGTIVHANNALSEFRISKTDSNAGDRSAELEALDIGDTIDDGNFRWAIQSAADNGTWMNFAVAPASQSSPDGTREFTFETVTATPITIGREVGYWSGTNQQGLLSIDVPYSDATLSEDAYGVDLLVQAAHVSLDWDVVAYSAGGGSGGSGEVQFQEVLRASSFLDQDPTGLGVALQLTLGDAQTNTYFDVDAAGNVTCIEGGSFQATLRLVTGREGSTGESQIYARVLLDGVQSGSSIHTIIDNTRIEVPLSLSGTLPMETGQVLTIEIIRDTDGDDSGGIRAGNPDVVGWSPSPSVQLVMNRVLS